jgi:hypothetical protein
MNKEKFIAFAHGYIAYAQNYEGIEDEWVDYADHCLNFYDNGERLIVTVYPMHYVESDGKMYHTQDTMNPVYEDILKV